MATYYNEFDSTVGTLIGDLITQITSSSDWTKISNTTTQIGTLGAASSAGATTITLTAGHSITTNQVLLVDTGSVKEYLRPYVVSATSMSLNVAARYAHANGAAIYTGSEVLKATTTRGANMIVDLTDTDTQMYMQPIAAYRNHTGAVGGGTDRLVRGLWWKNSPTGLLTTSPLHCTVSAGKEHLFVMVEGPRANETGPYSTQYGSNKSYIFMSDVVPYNASDTVPQVYCGGMTTSYSAGTSTSSHDGHLTRNYANTASWDTARLGSIQFPVSHLTTSVGDTYSVHLNRQSVIDGKFYLFPYVVFSNADGPRGRLSSFFNAGLAQSSVYDALLPAPIGSKVTYNGVLYKLIAVDKNNGSWTTWAQFGNCDTTLGSHVVAVPCT